MKVLIILAMAFVLSPVVLMLVGLLNFVFQGLF